MAVGAVVLVMLALDIWSTYRFIARAARADGMVIELNAGAAHPQVRFHLPSGVKIEFPANGYISYRVGQKAKVLYLPDRPQQSSRLDDFGDLWMGKVFDGVLGLAFVAIGLYKYVSP